MTFPFKPEKFDEQTSKKGIQKISKDWAIYLKLQSLAAVSNA